MCLDICSLDIITETKNKDTTITFRIIIVQICLYPIFQFLLMDGFLMISISSYRSNFPKKIHLKTQLDALDLLEYMVVFLNSKYLTNVFWISISTFWGNFFYKFGSKQSLYPFLTLKLNGTFLSIVFAENFENYFRFCLNFFVGANFVKYCDQKNHCILFLLYEKVECFCRVQFSILESLKKNLKSLYQNLMCMHFTIFF